MVDLKLSPFAYIKTRQADVLDPYVEFIMKSEQITLVICASGPFEPSTWRSG